MTDPFRLLDDPQVVGLLADPLRRRILQQLDTPRSATAVARALGLPRQRIGYHMRALEKHGFVEIQSEERRRGCIERVMRRTAESFVVAPDSMSEEKFHPQRVRDRFSSHYLLALASQMLSEVATAQANAESGDELLPTFSLQVDVRLATQQDKNAFAEELGREVARLAVKYHQPQSRGGRSYRVVIGSYPAPQGRSVESNKRPSDKRSG